MFLISLQSILIMLSFTVPGYLVVKFKLISGDNLIKTLSVILLFMCQPMITVNSFLNSEYTASVLINLGVVMVITFVLMLAVSLIGRFAIREKDIDRKAIYNCATFLGNVGFLAVPFVGVVTGFAPEPMLYSVMGMVTFNFLSWTLGCYLLSGKREYISLKRAVLNPPTLAFFLVLPFFFANINYVRFEWLAGTFGEFTKAFAQINGPLAMITLGARFVGMSPVRLFADAKLYIVGFIKLLIMPALMFCILLVLRTFMDISGFAFSVIAFAAMPTAASLVMFVATLEKDVQLASKAILLTTLLSIATIPLSFLLFYDLPQFG
jgi:hypothetical protein